MLNAVTVSLPLFFTVTVGVKPVVHSIPLGLSIDNTWRSRLNNADTLILSRNILLPNPFLLRYPITKLPFAKAAPPILARRCRQSFVAGFVYAWGLLPAAPANCTPPLLNITVAKLFPQSVEPVTANESKAETVPSK